MSSRHFRKDINGLRALAVLAVLVFHYSNSNLRGGFAGVDVFFVISGFLMTSIIFRGLEQGSFSFWRFMKARARRIVPALLAVVLLTLLLGVLLIDPANYQAMGQHALSTLTFVSNIAYNQEVDYFAAGPDQNVFLHSWSLSVEWQFYILYPFVLVLLHRLLGSVNALRRAVLVAAPLLCALSIYLSFHANAYYLLAARAWELLLGGLVWLYPLQRSIRHVPRWSLELVGLVLVLTSFFVLNESMRWPGVAAMLPLAGAWLCLQANHERSLLSNPIFQWLGLISYSLYLVHWVVLSLFSKTGIHLGFIPFAGLSILSASLIYLFIEKPRNYGLKTAALYGLSLLFAFWVSQNGLSSRIQNPQLALPMDKYSDYFYGGRGFPAEGKANLINADKPGPIDFILTGDSLSRQYARALQQRGLKVLTVFADACFSSEHYISQKNPWQTSLEPCEQRYASLKEAMQAHPDTNVVVAQNWYLAQKLVRRSDGTYVEDEHFNILSQELDALLRAGGQSRQYFFIGQPPDRNGPPAYQCQARRQLWFSRLIGVHCPTTMPQKTYEIDDQLKAWTQQHAHTHFLSLLDQLCRDGSCLIYDGDHLLYTDNVHFSEEGSTYIMDRLLHVILQKQSE